MRRSLMTVVVAVVIAPLALAGCGDKQKPAAAATAPSAGASAGAAPSTESVNVPITLSVTPADGKTGVPTQKANGGRLIVADPRRTPTARAADLHLQLTPGSDLALANGLLFVAIEERLLGVDITGQMDSSVVHDASVMQTLRAHAVETNRRFSEQLGINQSAAVTCVKPSGNSSQLMDTGSGIHARWAPFYLRRTRVSAATPLYRVLNPPHR